MYQYNIKYSTYKKTDLNKWTTEGEAHETLIAMDMRKQTTQHAYEMCTRVWKKSSLGGVKYFYSPVIAQWVGERIKSYMADHPMAPWKTTERVQAHPLHSFTNQRPEQLF